MVINNSKKYFHQALDVMVGGVNSPVRAFKSVGGNPLLIDHGYGMRFFDVDDNAYTDYCLSWGALILGHAHKDVVQAVRKTIKKGTSYGTSTKIEVEIARFIVKHVPSIEQIRFVNSGTEATMSAIRLARGYTERKKIIKFDGCYHGHSDDLLASAGSGVANLQSSSSDGVPKEHIQNTISLAFNNIDLFKETIEKHHQDIACVILEPVAGNMGVVRPLANFLITIRELTQKHNIILIFDEIMTGFRTSLGCVQSDFDIIPDMTCLGKIIGGGFPVGAYGGRKEIMQKLAPCGGVYQAGTFAGNPVVLTAGLATLKNLNFAAYKALNTMSQNFSMSLNAEFKKYGLNAYLSHYKGMMSIRFQPDDVRNYKEARKASSSTKYAKLFQFLLKNNIYWPPADLESFFISTRHSKTDFEILKNKLVQFFKKTKNS